MCVCVCVCVCVGGCVRAHVWYVCGFVFGPGTHTDTCVPPYATVRLQIPFEVRVMLSPQLTQSVADDCSASAQRFAVDVLGTGMAYVAVAHVCERVDLLLDRCIVVR